MNDNPAPSNLQHLVRVVARVVDREVKKRGMTALEVCGALGAVAGGSVGVNVPAEFDVLLLGVLAEGFTTVVGAARESKGQER